MGEEHIFDWLMSIKKEDGQKKYLLIDEANMKEPGYWDFLEGLETGEIYYKGRFYTVDSQLQKIIFTGNPEHYPGRHYHRFLQQIPKVSFKSHTDEYLQTQIILPRLKQNTSHADEISRMFIFAYKKAKEKLPYEPISIRDIKSLLDHFCYPELPKEEDAKSRAYLACIEVFAGLFKNAATREEYLHQLQDNFVGVKSLSLKQLPCTNDFYLPLSKQLLWNNVNQCIARGGKLPPGARRALLVEGDSGIGKTKIMIEALKAQGFNSAEHPGSGDKVYFHFTMGTNNISEKINDIRKLSSSRQVVIVIDELNLLQTEDEILLTSLLEGKMPGEEDQSIHNLVILASQNSQTEADVPPLSLSLLNRFDCMYEEPYTKDDLLELCVKSGAFSNNMNDEGMNRFVSQFLIGQKEDSDSINARTFFSALKNGYSATFFKEKESTMRHPGSPENVHIGLHLRC